jgi:Uma2 family endonuclease
MGPGIASLPDLGTVADLLERLGRIPASRVRWHPVPGTATEDDVLEVERRENRLCELVDGVLVEKAMGFRESLLAAFLIRVLQNHVAPRNLGLVAAPDGMVRLAAGLVRMPDVAFVSWSRLPDGRVPKVPIPKLAPDLAVEVLSPGNTDAEMARKRREYFEAGVQAVWLVDPKARTVAVYTALDRCKVLGEAETLVGDPVLPGFALPLRDLFGELDRQANV